MPGFTDHVQHLISSLTKLSLVGGSALWAWTRLKSDLTRIKSNIGGIGKKVSGSGLASDRSVLGTIPASMQRVVKSAPNALKTVKKQKEAIMSKPKKKFSFLKFLLVMGAIIALAIFLLDKFLPKPYRDDELEDAWAGEDLEPPETEGVSSDNTDADEDEDEGSEDDEPKDE